jgi:hypothetical protein
MGRQSKCHSLPYSHATLLSLTFGLCGARNHRPCLARPCHTSGTLFKSLFTTDGYADGEGAMPARRALSCSASFLLKNRDMFIGPGRVQVVHFSQACTRSAFELHAYRASSIRQLGEISHPDRSASDSFISEWRWNEFTHDVQSDASYHSSHPPDPRPKLEKDKSTS